MKKETRKTRKRKRTTWKKNEKKTKRVREKAPFDNFRGQFWRQRTKNSQNEKRKIKKERVREKAPFDNFRGQFWRQSPACHGISALSPLDAALTMRFAENTQRGTRLKCCACYAKWWWRSPKCRACSEKCNSFSDIDAKVLRLSHKTTLDTLWNMLECVTKCRACSAKRGCATFGTSKRDHFFRPGHRHDNIALTTVARERLRTQKQRGASTSQPPGLQSKTGNLRYALGNYIQYSILYACSTLLKGHRRPWRICCFILCNIPLTWVRYLIKRIHYRWIVLEKIFEWGLLFRPEWMKAGLIKGKSTYVKGKSSSFPRMLSMLFLHRKIVLPYRTMV